MSDPKSWTLALRSGRLGRMLSRKRGMIGEVPLPVAKQWTDARDYAHQHFLARVHRRPPCSVAHESRKVCLGGRANRIRSLAPPPTPPYEDIKREYPTTSDSSAAELTELLIDQLVDYRAPVRQCSTHDLGTPVANALAERGVNTVVVPTGLDPSWTTGLSADVLTDGVSVVDQLSVSQLDAVDGVMTSCAVAIAETGTLILDRSPGQGRRVLTLIPDYHLCVVLLDQICPDVPPALARLTPTRPLTMISGPSATSDIELNRVEGVHGPQRSK